jgi:general secretion pathway protein G
MKTVAGGSWLVADEKAVAGDRCLVAGIKSVTGASRASVARATWSEVLRRSVRARPSSHGARWRGFTLVELMVVLAIIALLVSIVAPHYVGRLARAEETVLQENLVVMRDALDKYFADTGTYPQSLEELVSKRYLRNIPTDPVTQSNATWILVPPTDAMLGAGVYDVRSGAKGSGSNGKPYEQW